MEKGKELVLLSGQIGIDKSGKLVEGGVEEETRQALKNIQTALKEYGLTLENVISCQVFLHDINDFKAFNKVYSEMFGEHFPVRAAVGGLDLPAGAAVEICVVAEK